MRGGDKDAASAVGAIRAYWGPHPEPSKDELFWTEWRKYERSKERSAAENLLLQIVALGLEEELLLWLLHLHCADAGDTVQTLLDASRDPYFATMDLELMGPLLDALLRAAIVHATGCSWGADHRTSKRKELLAAMEAAVFVGSKALNVLVALGEDKGFDNEDGELNDTDVWKQFLEMPHAVDNRVSNSRNERTFLEETEQVVEVQQLQLMSRSGGVDRINVGEHECAAELLWDISNQLVGLITSKTQLNNYGGSSLDEIHLSEQPASTDLTDMEKYLEVKASLHLKITDEVLVDDLHEDGMETSLLRQLCADLQTDEPIISGEFIERVFDELSTTKDIDVLATHASFLLGVQIRLQRSVFDCCNDAKSGFEKRVRREFNSLTGKAQGRRHLATFVALSAFCPKEMIVEVLRSARADMSHHKLYVEVLRLSPLILDWNKDSKSSETSFFYSDLQQLLREISSDQTHFDREQQNMVAFVLALVGLSSSGTINVKSAAFSIEELFQSALIPLASLDYGLHEVVIQSLQMQLNLYSLIQTLLIRFEAAIRPHDIDPASLKEMFTLISRRLCDLESSNSRQGIMLRETLLLILKTVIQLSTDLESVVDVEYLPEQLHPSLWTLVGLFSTKLRSNTNLRGLCDAVDEHQRKEDDKFVDSASLSCTSSAISVKLWRLLWISTFSDGSRHDLKLLKDVTLSQLDEIASAMFYEVDLAEPVRGSVIIQCQVAKLMLECGDYLFQVLRISVIPHLLKYDCVGNETGLEESVFIPNRLTKQTLEQEEIESHLPCCLELTHGVMRYVAKCWGISAVASNQFQSPPGELVVESLRHVLSSVESAKPSCERTLAGILYCIQTLCCLVSFSCAFYLDNLPTWPLVRTQLELVLLRLLHQLTLLKGVSPVEEQFSQHFIAAWFTCLPASQFKQTFNFLVSKT